ncbi:MAG: hypothetical protein Q8Q06_00145 [bacterium]|nr:hypothetical protein [bacterium]
MRTWDVLFRLFFSGASIYVAILMLPLLGILWVDGLLIYWLSGSPFFWLLPGVIFIFLVLVVPAVLILSMRISREEVKSAVRRLYSKGLA